MMTRTGEYSFARSRLDPNSKAADRLEHFERLIPYSLASTRGSTIPRWLSVSHGIGETTEVERLVQHCY